MLGKPLISLVTSWEGYAYCVVKSILFRIENFSFLIHKPYILAHAVCNSRTFQHVGFFINNVGVCRTKQPMPKLLLVK